MLTPRNGIIAGIILFACLTCEPDKHSHQDGQMLVDWGSGKNRPTSAGQQKTVSGRKVTQRQKNFLDSVLVKMDLSFDQVKTHVNIDPAYDRDDAQFSGDTVWFRTGKHPLAIISYDSGGINKKFLLVFNKRGKCTAILMVGMDGDVDGGFDAISLNYKIFDNDTFCTTETWKHKEGKKDNKVTVTEQYYWINNKGSIMAQNNMVHSFLGPRDQAASQ
jgi:hypothetical protein